MMSGGAGAGKSTVIKLVAQWVQRILQQEGQDVDFPCVIITSFCGTAAANVDGQKRLKTLPLQNKQTNKLSI